MPYSFYGPNALFSRMVICPSNLVFEYKFFGNANQTMFSYLNFKRIFTRKRGWTGILPYVRRAYTRSDFLCYLLDMATPIKSVIDGHSK